MSKKRILKSVYLTEEENTKVLKEMFKLSEKQGRMVSFSEAIRCIINEYLNSNKPPTQKPVIETQPNTNSNKVSFADVLENLD